MMKLTAMFMMILAIPKLFGQQRPQYTQYIMNSFIINPAVAGIENYTDLKISHRHQWIGIDGSPVTTYLTVQGPLHKSDAGRENPVSLHPEGENPRGSNYWDQYAATDPHAGIGLTLLNDKTGPLNRFSVSGAYAYHLPVGKKISLSAGIAAGVQNLTLNTSKLYFGENTNIDPAVAGSGYLHQWKPDISAGLWLYSARFFAGIAAQNIVSSGLSYSNETVQTQRGKLIPHLFVNTGYRFLLTEDINFLPSVMIKYIQPAAIGYELSTKFQYRDFLWAGASYRYKDGFAGMLGINISNTVNLGYSYDETTSKFGAVSGGTHELLIGFLIGNRYGDWCPRNVW